MFFRHAARATAGMSSTRFAQLSQLQLGGLGGGCCAVVFQLASSHRYSCDAAAGAAARALPTCPFTGASSATEFDAALSTAPGKAACPEGADRPSAGATDGASASARPAGAGAPAGAQPQLPFMVFRSVPVACDGTGSAEGVAHGHMATASAGTRMAMGAAAGGEGGIATARAERAPSPPTASASVHVGQRGNSTTSHQPRPTAGTQTAPASAATDSGHGAARRLVPSSFQEMVAATTEPATGIVLFGEVHNDPIAHTLQGAVYHTMVHAPTNTAGKCVLSMEMLERGCEETIDAFLAGTATADALIPWPNKEDYFHMAHTAQASQSPIIAANPPRAVVSTVYKQGLAALDDLDDSVAQLLPPRPFHPPSAGLVNKLMGVFGEIATRKEGEGEDEFARRVDRLIQAHNCWDVGMAHSIMQARRDHPDLPLMHVCGKMHTEHFLGVPEHIARTNPAERAATLVIVCHPVDDFAEADTWDAVQRGTEGRLDTGIATDGSLAHMADFVVFTDSSHMVD